ADHREDSAGMRIEDDEPSGDLGDLPQGELPALLLALFRLRALVLRARGERLFDGLVGRLIGADRLDENDIARLDDICRLTRRRQDFLVAQLAPRPAHYLEGDAC